MFFRAFRNCHFINSLTDKLNKKAQNQQMSFLCFSCTVSYRDFNLILPKTKSSIS